MAVNYERKKRKEQGESLESYSSGKELIAQIKRIMKYHKDVYGSETIFDYEEAMYSDTRYLYSYYERDETDAEMAERIKNEERWDKDQKERDAREYARLKAKFEGNAS